ncbi:hypothetical protein IJG90_02675 [Candidatus Saccharibacteria bacterium]|nr:hypothetical protein [Candidatus Saccharibacteria bacterium]
MLNDKKPRRHLILMLVGLILVIVFGVGWKVINLTAEPELIIRFHYSGFRVIQNIANVLLYASAALMGTNTGLLIRDYSKYRKEKMTADTSMREAKEKREDERKKNPLTTPEGIHRYIQDVKTEFFSSNSKMYHLAATVLGQLDKMNEFQDKLDKLFSANDISGLGDARDLLQDIEDAICMVSTKRLINYYIVGGGDAFLEHVERTISDNQLLLDQASGVLSDIVEYINGDKSVDDVTSHIIVFRKTIQRFMKEENDDENQFQKDFGSVSLLGGGN